MKNTTDTNLNYPKIKTVVDLFSEQLKRVPNKIAVSFDDTNLTYRELDIHSNQFADYLIKKHSIGKGDFVGLMLERSEWLIVSILGIIKAGGVYVPIDPEFPQERKNYINKDSKSKVIVDTALLDNFQSIKEKCSDDSPKNVNLKFDDLIYVIYTSGTTGNPKGVMIEHKSVVNLIYSQTKLFEIDDSERILQFSNYCFDASVEQIFLSLLNGATLYMADKGTLKNHLLSSFIKEHQITHLHATPSYLETIPDLTKLKSLKRIIAGGETCPLKLAQKLGKHCNFYNEYGPTETTVTSTVYKYSSKDNHQDSLSIGKPISNTDVYIVSESMKLLPVGSVGELCLSGDGLARGYLNQEEITSDKFISNPFEPNTKLYRTGDYAKLTENGNIEFVGRKDDQVKIRGYRMELGEIESALSTLPNITRAVVVASDYLSQEQRLVAYIKLSESEKDIKNIKEQLLNKLPEYMVPTTYMYVDEFPKTSTGKIDKKKLPNPVNKRPESAPLIKKPRTITEEEIVKIWQEELFISEIGIDDNFFEMGGTSLLTQKVSALIFKRLNLNVPVTKIYQFPTIAELSDFLKINTTPFDLKKVTNQKNKRIATDVAVIGMAGRFPGANNIHELWEVLKEGKETISFFSPDELDKSIPETLKNDPLYVAARGVIANAKEFDATFFGINQRLAQAMDPQQRLFLEIAWEALEHSGYLPKHYNGRIGVYAGTGTNTYYVNNVLKNKELVDSVGAFQADIVNDKGFVATRTAYHLNLKGPAISVHSACSTSLLAIAEGVEAIRSGQSDVVLAGGSSITAPVNSGHLYQEGSMLSSDGHCKSFDADGKGTVFSDGAGVVLLKSLEAAKRDGDIIYGVVKGVGINNDGGHKGSFTAPSVEGQAGAISNAFVDAGIEPSTISYLEAHGTATPLGDPIEMEGLHTVFGKSTSESYCALGSIKSNMGHLTAAAGVASFIKTILSMNHQKIPASLGFKSPNPSIDFENSPFYVNNKLSDWKSKGPRRAGISSFGVGGTNVHVVVEEHKTPPQVSSEAKPLQIITWSAKSETSLNGYKTALGNFIKSSGDINLADVAWSLSKTRDTFSKRSFIIANTNENAYSQLLSNKATSVKTSELKVVPSNLAFLFPGQGAQYLQMGKALYEHETVFREAVDTCSEILLEALNFDIRSIIYPNKNTPEAENLLKDTQYTQPALFVIEYALSQLWMSWGIQPTLLCGHSVGEFVAAHLAGIFNLNDALLLVALRGKLVSNLPGGSMLSVRATHDLLSKILPETLCVAAVNSDQLCVVSGEDKAITEFIKVLEEKEIPNRLLATSHAFHSTMMNPVLEAFKLEVKKVSLNNPRIPIISTVTGSWLSETEATDPNYWTEHLRATVRFSDAMETALELEDLILLEVGPGRALTTLSQQKKNTKSASSISSLVVPNENESSYSTVLNALGQLWLKGIEPDWEAFYKGQTRQMVWLPAYVFDRKLCWVDPPLQEIPNEDNQRPIETSHNQTIPPQMNTVTSPNRKTLLLGKVSEIVLNTSGTEIEPTEYDYSFLELGLDSLVLTQMAITCKNEFKTPITFRQLNGEFSSPNLLASYLDENLPPESFAPPTTTNNGAIPNTTNHTNSLPTAIYANNGSAIDLIAQQIQLLGKQVELLKGNTPAPIAVQQPLSNKVTTTTNSLSEIRSEDEIKDHKKPFGAAPKIERQASELTSEQQIFLDKLISSYNKKTARSKAYTQKHRMRMADPRVVTGFKPLTKELVYPIVIEKSSGNRLWDLDGNEYIDTLNGFGSCLFGYQPDFIKQALHKQVDLGFEVGPQHPLAGEICELLCEFTGHERAALCNTGSEAVLGAMRIARTVTGRSLVIAFTGSYHGINDEAIVRGSKKLKTFPAAAGIMKDSVQNVMLLDYGTEESLQIIRERAHEVAAVLVEPVQSRRPEFQPIEFLKEVRKITKASETVLIFDEIITGFRMHLGGTQALFGIKADIATYGKTIGGGISIGAILGYKKYMDALDGGFWEYGDESIPEVGVTYFAGTFVRHPLALASTKASLEYMKAQGKTLQDNLNTITKDMALDLNKKFREQKFPMLINYYGSLWRIKFTEEIPYSELLFVLLRENGIHIWDGFPCYMTNAYTLEDINRIKTVLFTCINELEVGGFLKTSSDLNKPETVPSKPKKSIEMLNTPPTEGAKLGIDENGNPAWFVTNDQSNGEYLKIDL